MDKALDKYPNSLEEDILILEQDTKENNLSNNEKNCILYRKIEKQILNTFKDYA